MTWMTEPPITAVVRPRDRDGTTARQVERARRSGAATRIARGSYAASDAWQNATPLDRHAQLVWEASGRLTRGAVFSHHAAAAVLGIDLVGSWPRSIDVTTSGSSGSSGLIRRHRSRLESDEVVPWGDHFVTSAARTVVDLASVLPFADAVVAADQALWRRRAGGALCTRDELDRAASRYRGRSHVRVAAVAAFATELSDSVRESESRVLIDRLGFPVPVLQQAFVLDDGRHAVADFWWPEHEHVGEFDGTGKYLDASLRGGRSPAQVLLAEKEVKSLLVV